MVLTVIDFTPAREGGLIEEEEKIISIFDSSFKLLSQDQVKWNTEIERAAKEVAKLVSTDKSNNQFESIWEGFITMAVNINHQNDAHDFVLDVLRKLAQEEPWRDLPFLAEIMRDRWIGSFLSLFFSL